MGALVQLMKNLVNFEKYPMIQPALSMLKIAWWLIDLCPFLCICYIGRIWTWTFLRFEAGDLEVSNLETLRWSPKAQQNRSKPWMSGMDLVENFPNFHGVFFGVHSLKESKALWGVSFNDGFVAGQRTKPAQGVATVAAGTMETCGDGDSSQQRSSRLRQSTWNVLLNMRSNSMTDCEGGGKVCPKSFQSFGSCKSLEAVFCCFMASIFPHQWPSNSFDMLFFSSVVRLWFVWGPDRARSIVGCCRALSSCHFVWIENTATLCHDWGVHILILLSL